MGRWGLATNILGVNPVDYHGLVKLDQHGGMIDRRLCLATDLARRLERSPAKMIIEHMHALK